MTAASEFPERDICCGPDAERARDSLDTAWNSGHAVGYSAGVRAGRRLEAERAEVVASTVTLSATDDDPYGSVGAIAAAVLAAYKMGLEDGSVVGH